MLEELDDGSDPPRGRVNVTRRVASTRRRLGSPALDQQLLCQTSPVGLFTTINDPMSCFSVKKGQTSCWLMCSIRSSYKIGSL